MKKNPKRVYIPKNQTRRALFALPPFPFLIKASRMSSLYKNNACNTI
ncbi:hypothetical protein CGRA01v4_09363 [Colletotrichum graminicola]|nr:hypothetical protein CGRA01v4_09363 [Colletotrichum graminicola]